MTANTPLAGLGAREGPRARIPEASLSGSGSLRDETPTFQPALPGNTDIQIQRGVKLRI